MRWGILYKHTYVCERTHMLIYLCIYIWGFPGGRVVKYPPANAGNERDMGLILELGRSSGEGNDNPFQNPCLENSMDRGAWWATVHRVTKSQTQLSTT